MESFTCLTIIIIGECYDTRRCDRLMQCNCDQVTTILGTRGCKRGKILLPDFLWKINPTDTTSFRKLPKTLEKKHLKSLKTSQNHQKPFTNPLRNYTLHNTALKFKLINILSDMLSNISN